MLFIAVLLKIAPNTSLISDSLFLFETKVNMGSRGICGSRNGWVIYRSIHKRLLIELIGTWTNFCLSEFLDEVFGTFALGILPSYGSLRRLSQSFARTVDIVCPWSQVAAVIGESGHL